MMKFSSTILEALNHHATETPDKVVFTWVDNTCQEQNKMTFKQLEDASNAVAARLRKLGCKKGDRVMVSYPFGLEFLAGMFGAMKIGVIPCSIYPPNPNQLKTEMPKFRGFAEDAGAKYALSTNTFATAMAAASVLYKTGVTWIGTDKLSIKKPNPNKPKGFEKFVGEPEELCFIQYTSGSTGRPKGVMITHNNLVETCRAGISLTDLNTASVAALWVPQYHDMGLTGFMSCLYTGSQLVVASPLDFISRPLLWSDMVETYKATHTSAPNFAYALLLKRLEQANRKADWSFMKAAMFGGEPAQSHVVDAVAKTLSINPEHVYNIYGMAEMVVFVTGGPAKADSDEGLMCCGKVDSPTLMLRIVQDGKEVVDGQVGSIWAQSPRVAVGYYGQPELTKSTFSNALPGYDGTWLDTGDLGKIVDGQLYITGRIKDVIIINGKNYYPTDVELSIDEAFGSAIRPGRTSAFQHGDASIGITMEGRKGFDKSANEDLAVDIANHVSQAHGLFASEVVVLNLGVTPKTTSGKLKRSEIRQTTMAGDWKVSDVLLRFQRQAKASPFQANVSPSEKGSFLEHSFAMKGVTSSEFYLSERTQREIHRRSMTLPFGSLDIGSEPKFELHDIDLSQTSVRLPTKAVEAVLAVECDPSKLDEYFSELRLSGVSGIDEAWSTVTKTTAAMQAMCSQILKHLEDKHPTICQLAHSLVVNPDWILIDDRTGFLSQLVHQIFVLEWVTTFMMDHPECMHQKLKNDAAWEAQDHNDQTVPVELQEILNLPEKDSMYGKLPFFLWIKHRSVTPLLNIVNQSLVSAEGPTINAQVERINNLLCLNMLEAIWVEQTYGHKENSELGRRLATNPVMTATTLSKKVLMEHSSNTSAWKDLYIDWDMHIVAWVGDRNSSSWILSKLLLPSIVGDVSGHFFHARLISLYLVTQATGSKLMSNKFQNEPILSRRALHYFGKLNLACAEKFGYIPLEPESKNQLALDEDYWLSKFDQWVGVTEATDFKSSEDLRRIESKATNLPNDFHRVVSTILGDHWDPHKTWTENGLTSLMSAELKNRVEEELHVMLPVNFEQVYATPDLLADFMATSGGESFPKRLAINHPDFHWNLERSSCTKLQLGIIQILALVAIVILVMVSIVPSYWLGAWAIDYCADTEAEECNGLVFWILLPITFPLFLLSFSLIVVLCKTIIIGKYIPRQFGLLTWDYIQWWFVDRMMHMWEVLVGRYVLETKFAWTFYWLLGAELAFSTNIDGFMREFDLIKIGKDASLKHLLHCRKFHLSNGDTDSPSMTFRPIIIGKNSTISGMVSPGASIGDGCKVEKLTCVEEGAMVPDGVVAKGVPACDAGSYQHKESISWEESILDAIKIAWMFVEAYHFFALFFLVNGFLNAILPTWRYATLLHWFLLIPTTSLLAMTTSIILKWLLIGKRDPSQAYGGSLWQRATNWACDFHFKLASWPIFPFFGNSRLWNVLLYLHGLDVDIVSMLTINPSTIFYPSKVDFLKVERSFVGGVSVDMESATDRSRKIEIKDSSIGHNAHLDAGCTIVRSTIPPRSQVSGAVYDLNKSNCEGKNRVKTETGLSMVLREGAQMILNLFIFASLIPAYELGSASVRSSNKTMVTFGVVLVPFLQFFVWVLLSKGVYLITFLDATKPILPFLFGAYLNHAWIFSTLNWMVFLIYGTPMFGYYAQFMGSEADGDIWYFGNALYEYGHLHFKGNVLVDNAHITGHYIDGKGITIAETFVSGVVHPGCYAPAGSVVSAEENGPWKLFYALGKQNKLDVCLQRETCDLIETARDCSINQSNHDDFPSEFEV
ncbi:D-alanine--D-alanyl carrier protein ligase [Seminavis robusta]|uniref:D-alanine--D-alanyl carrier protein ligase n=1 Tax=Seminavis robusta TaxID=568900 RepID=A0A9N8HUG2_9STRA|nr:D-alanine--D-alanyl carrier protein ligase [Seminavis robusta]|eukprot:Sro2071_g313390.1 D-alanine--D-alanyl carrier protein ligase (1806) ;mRNA; f:3900-9492